MKKQADKRYWCGPNMHPYYSIQCTYTRTFWQQRESLTTVVRVENIEEMKVCSKLFIRRCSFLQNWEFVGLIRYLRRQYVEGEELFSQMDVAYIDCWSKMGTNTNASYLLIILTNSIRQILATKRGFTYSNQQEKLELQSKHSCSKEP